jgi:hypothetical protein
MIYIIFLYKMSISDEFKSYISKLTTLDEEIDTHATYIKKLRKKRDQVEENIIDYIKKNSMEKTEIYSGKIKLKYTVRNTPVSFSKKSISDILNIYYKDKDKAEQLTKYLYNNRPKNSKEILKRVKIK